MSAGRRDFERAAGVLLALDVRQVDDRLGIGGVLDRGAPDDRLRGPTRPEVGHQLGQRPASGSPRSRRPARPRRRRRPARRRSACRAPGPARPSAGRPGGGAACRPATARPGRRPCGRRRRSARTPAARRWRSADRRRAGLAHLGRRQIDGDPARREEQPAVPDGRPHSFAGLLHGRVRQPHDGQLDDPLTSDIDFDLDELPVQADDGAGPDLCQHRAINLLAIRRLSRRRLPTEVSVCPTVTPRSRGAPYKLEGVARCLPYQATPRRPNGAGIHARRHEVPGNE